MAVRNAVLTRNAREALVGNWPLAIGTFLAFGLLSSIGGGVALILGGPLQLGASIFSLNITRKNNPDFANLFDGFKRFAESLIAYLLMVIYVMLWALLLIIPGIIAAIAYSQTFFLLADNPELKGTDALKQSREMMSGYKWKYFCLGLRFFGWALLCLLTLGIGFLWLIPYIQVSYAEFYEDLKNDRSK